MRIEIECPYCNKIHVHRINAQAIPKVEPVVDELPHDEETGDLREHQEEKK